jgi:hypothetical protein
MIKISADPFFWINVKISRNRWAISLHQLDPLTSNKPYIGYHKINYTKKCKTKINLINKFLVSRIDNKNIFVLSKPIANKIYTMIFFWYKKS